MKKIGTAIQRMYQEKDLLLVDYFDQELDDGKNRLAESFQNVGNPSDRERTNRDILSPLVHFGYLDEIPDDPYVDNSENSIFNTFLYFDEEHSIKGKDWNNLSHFPHISGR